MQKPLSMLNIFFILFIPFFNNFKSSPNNSKRVLLNVKLFFIFLQSITNKMFDFTWIQNRPPKSFFVYATNLRKIKKIFGSKLTKQCVPNIIKSIKNHENRMI